MLTVDAGDFGPTAPGGALGWEFTEFVASMLPNLKVDAWTPGERELYFGADSLQSLARIAGVPVVSANVADKDGKLLFPESRTVSLGQLRVAITGVSHLSGIPGLPGGQFEDYKLKDPGATLSALVPRLRQEADVVVVLAHLYANEADSLARLISGIDVIVVGHNPGYVAVQKAGEAMLIRPSNMGKMVARAHFKYESGRIVDYKGFEDVLKDYIRDEPVVGRAVAAFRTKHGIKDPPPPPAPTPPAPARPGTGH